MIQFKYSDVRISLTIQNDMMSMEMDHFFIMNLLDKEKVP